MSKRLLIVLFIISMAFNIAFVGGVGYHLTISRTAHRLIPPGINPQVRNHYLECRKEISRK